jgi:hypothetical protein
MQGLDSYRRQVLASLLEDLPVQGFATPPGWPHHPPHAGWQKMGGAAILSYVAPTALGWYLDRSVEFDSLDDFTLSVPGDEPFNLETWALKAGRQLATSTC